ncbi:MAG: isoprenylcysteine carboxylmethyltransferase family protein [Bacteriovoracaceae bacterium]|nr:isoprenylcysteine carboxylmethyltransferase family protein [Bacteriovoracaceae bacterium]
MLELKVPPLIVTLIFGFLMWTVSILISFNYGHYFFKSASCLVFLVGLVIALVAVLKFRKEDTTVDPRDPTKSERLVVTGVYRYTRNPMYLSFLLFLVSYGLFLGNLANLISLLLFILYMNLYQIKPEEKILLAKFQSSYRVYMQTVRRWL